MTVPKESQDETVRLVMQLVERDRRTREKTETPGGPATVDTSADTRVPGPPGISNAAGRIGLIEWDPPFPKAGQVGNVRTSIISAQMSAGWVANAQSSAPTAAAISTNTADNYTGNFSSLINELAVPGEPSSPVY